MPSTSVHFPPDLLERLDRVATARRTSRNRVIVQACQEAVERARGTWPKDFFSNTRLSPSDLRLLRRSFDPWLRSLMRARRSKDRPPFSAWVAPRT